MTTVGEAILNIRFHAINIFNYGEENKEYGELIEDLKLSGFNIDDKIEDCLKLL